MISKDLIDSAKDQTKCVHSGTGCKNTGQKTTVVKPSHC